MAQANAASGCARLRRASKKFSPLGESTSEVASYAQTSMLAHDLPSA